jgi:hypothetical protein
MVLLLAQTDQTLTGKVLYISRKTDPLMETWWALSCAVVVSILLACPLHHSLFSVVYWDILVFVREPICSCIKKMCPMYLLYCLTLN